MFLILGCLGLAVGSVVVARRPDNACDGYLDVTLVWGPAEASMATCLSPMMPYLHGSQPLNSLLHLDYAIRGSCTLGHMHVLIRNTVLYASLQ